MSRKERHSRSARGARPMPPPLQDEQAAGEDQAKLPPRRKKYPSSINKLYKWYFNLLFLLFVALVVFLFWYGNKFTQ
jgi:hypothetical protein